MQTTLEQAKTLGAKEAAAYLTNEVSNHSHLVRTWPGFSAAANALGLAEQYLESFEQELVMAYSHGWHETVMASLTKF